VKSFKNMPPPTSHSFKDTINPSSLLVIAWALQAGANVHPNEITWFINTDYLNPSLNPKP